MCVCVHYTYTGFVPKKEGHMSLDYTVVVLHVCFVNIYVYNAYIQPL